VHLESSSNSIICESGLEHIYASNSLKQVGVVPNGVDTRSGHKLSHMAPKLAIVPLPQLDVEIYSSSPAVSTCYQAPAPRLRRAKSIVFVEDDESEISPPAEEGTIEEGICIIDGLRQNANSIASGLGITIDETYTPREEATNSTTLRRVDGCLDLKSLWFEVSRAIRSPGMCKGRLAISCSLADIST
jgi:hypothetical protein